MAWEQYDKRKPAPTAQPRVTIQKNGVVTFNNAARFALDNPSFVNLFYDPVLRRVGFKKAEANDPMAYQFRQQGSTTTYNVSGQGFCRYYGIKLPHTRRYAASMDGDILAIKLDSPAEEYA